MPNEIYHRSEWGNPKAEGFGDVYFDASATNKLYNHSDNYENSDGTDKILRDIPNKASIVLTPTAYSDGSLNTVLPTDGNGDFDFSRGSSATRVNEKGLIEDVASNIPRIDYTSGQGALLLEPQSTNLITYSEDFSQSYWNKTNSLIESNNTISPNGNLNASKLKENVSNGNHNIYSNNLPVTLGSEYTFSLYLKKAERSIIKIDGGFRLTLGATFNLDTLDVTGEGTIEHFKDDWYKITANGVGEVSSGVTNIFIFLLNDDGVQSYQGDGTSGVYIWGAQLEQKSFATSYIKTEGSTVTRSADVANNSGNADLINSTEGVLYAEISALANDGTNRTIALNKDTNDRIQMYFNTSDNGLNIFYKAQGTHSFIMNETLSDATEFNKIAFKWKTNDFSLYVNGIETDTVSNGVTSNADTLNALEFEMFNNSSSFYGNVKELAVFKEALTDAELEKLTS